MNAPLVVEYSAIPPTPWKNGRGVTRNLFDDATDAGVWTWRVSIAEITGTQPYSPYPGVRRGQVALGPGAVDLRIDGRDLVLDPEEIVVFDGEAEVTASPREAGFLDLNVMTAVTPGRATCSASTIRASQKRATESSSSWLSATRHWSTEGRWPDSTP